MTEIQAILRELIAEPPAAGALCTLVSVEGSSYRRPGARLLLSGSLKLGSISGGCLEEDLVTRARRVAATGTADLVTYDTTSENDLIWGVGLGCHGVVRVLIEQVVGTPRWAPVLATNFAAHRVTELSVIWQSKSARELGTHLTEETPTQPETSRVFLERVQPPQRLVIFGAGDDAQPLARMAKQLGWHVTIADPRSEFASATRFPEADERVVAPAGELVAKINPPADALAVVMTHHYVHDLPILAGLLERPLRYVGLLGPKKRAKQIIGEIERDAGGPVGSAASHVRAPVGLDIGAENPEEVAVSIIAEMRAVLSGRDGRPLRDRQSPIHGP